MKRYALLMARDEYEHFKECPFCQADSEEILDTLVNYCDYSYESTQMLGLYSHDDEITPTYIFEVIQKILEQCEIDDTLLVYFAGHGLLEEESGNMYLVLPRSDPDTLESTGINLNSLYQLLSSGKGNSFLILDVPENLRSMSFVSVAKRIRQVHYEMNNFYNEPAEVKKTGSNGNKNSQAGN